MKDPRMASMMSMDGKNMPFDAKRRIFGGFKVAVDVYVLFPSLRRRGTMTA